MSYIPPEPAQETPQLAGLRRSNAKRAAAKVERNRSGLPRGYTVSDPVNMDLVNARSGRPVPAQIVDVVVEITGHREDGKWRPGRLNLTWAMAPHALLAIPGAVLSAEAKLVAIYILDRMKICGTPDHLVKHKRDVFMANLGMSKRAVARSLEELERAGLICVKQGHSHASHEIWWLRTGTEKFLKSAPKETVSE